MRTRNPGPHRPPIVSFTDEELFTIAKFLLIDERDKWVGVNQLNVIALNKLISNYESVDANILRVLNIYENAQKLKLELPEPNPKNKNNYYYGVPDGF